MFETDPIQTFRGTIDEVLSHQSEIPEGAMLELRVYQPEESAVEDDDFGGKTFGDLFGHLLGGAEGGPRDLARNPDKYMTRFGEKDRRVI